MDEVWLRLGLIGGALLVAASATLVIRSRATGRPREIVDAGLGPGVYFFSSSACPDCGSARQSLVDALGTDGFEELSWEHDPGEFHRLEVTAVPATMVVSGDGSAVVWPGKAERALESLGP